MIGDCARCTHSIAYHVPLAGCLKCSCGEYRIARAVIGMAIVLFTASACGEFADPRRAVEAMESAGYSDVHVVERSVVVPSLSGCSDSDDVAFTVTAKNPAGKNTKATVCCGLLLKGCTIRH